MSGDLLSVEHEASSQLFNLHFLVTGAGEHLFIHCLTIPFRFPPLNGLLIFKLFYLTDLGRVLCTSWVWIVLFIVLTCKQNMLWWVYAEKSYRKKARKDGKSDSGELGFLKPHHRFVPAKIHLLNSWVPTLLLLLMNLSLKARNPVCCSPKPGAVFLIKLQPGWIWSLKPRSPVYILADFCLGEAELT